MITQKQITGKEARKKMINGVNAVGDIVRRTIGPFGRNSNIDGVMTNDGVMIGSSINLDDNAENLGAFLIKDAASKTNKQVGDGTTTTTLLTQELSNRFLRLLDSGTSAMDIKKHAKVALDVIKEDLKKTAVKCDTVKDLTSIATISVEDPIIGKLIAETTYSVGKNGVVMIAESKTGETYAEVMRGVKIERGYVSPYLCTNKEKLEAVYSNIPILVTDKNITDFDDLMPILKKLKESGEKKIAIICDDLTGDAFNDVLTNHLNGAFTILAIRGPIGTQKKGGMADIAIATGAKLFTDDLKMDLKGAKISDLGFAASILAKKDETLIINGGGNKKDIAKRISEINHEISTTKSDYEKEKLTERAARLGNGIGIIYVGGEIVSDQTYLKMKIEDAINATKHAFTGGVVAGSGYGLYLSASKLLNEVNVFREIKAACFECINQILENSDMPFQEKVEVVHNLNANKHFKFYNVIEKRYFNNPVQEGIIDPVAVEIAAITNAITAATMLVTIDSLIVNKMEDIKE